MHYAVRAILHFRSFVQRREMRKPALIIGLSRRFNELLIQDYGVPPQRLAVLYHPIRAAGENCSVDRHGPPGTPVKLLFAGRISVRKGVEQLIELSHRLDDLAGKIQIDVVGDRTQWSDYTAHLKELNPRTDRFLAPYRTETCRRFMTLPTFFWCPACTSPAAWSWEKPSATASAWSPATKSVRQNPLRLTAAAYFLLATLPRLRRACGG